MTVGWKVVKQVSRKGDDGSGNFVDGVEVDYESDSGVVSSVFFPMNQYNVENVTATLRDLNATHQAIADLSG